MDPLLEQLRDIHVPLPVSWWPPAPGYWIMLVVLIAMIAAWLVRRRRNRIGRLIRREFESLISAFAQHQDETRLAQQLSVLLRRAAITLGSRAETASTTGAAWIEALEKLVEHKQIRFSSEVANLLTKGIYQKDGVRKAGQVINQLISECRNWVRALPAGKVAI